MVMRPLHGNKEDESRAYNNEEKVPMIVMSQRKYHTLNRISLVPTLLSSFCGNRVRAIT